MPDSPAPNPSPVGTAVLLTLLTTWNSTQIYIFSLLTTQTYIFTPYHMELNKITDASYMTVTHEKIN